MGTKSSKNGKKIHGDNIKVVKSSAKRRAKESSSLSLTKKQNERRESAEVLLLLEESQRRNTLNGALVSELTSAVILKNRLALSVTILMIIQIVFTNALFAYMIFTHPCAKPYWPSDKLILGWFASTVVEIIGLYAIVLRGVFTPTSLDQSILQGQE